MDMQSDLQVSGPSNGDNRDSSFYKIQDPIGYALLLGCSAHSASQNHPTGFGSPPSVREDLAMMENTLKKMDWGVYSPCLDETGAAELTGDSCEQIVNNLEREELEKHSCFMLYYSGYGVANGIMGTNGKVVPYRDIVNKIGHLDVIAGKPKIFIFDCHRYDDPKVLNNLQNQGDMSYGQQLEEHLRQDQLVDSYPPPDCILCYSACEGTEPTVGSFFTTELCRSLQQFGQKLPFVEIVTLVNRGTANVLGSVFELGQRPFYCSTLTRNLVLSARRVNRGHQRPQIVSSDAPTDVDQPPSSSGLPSGSGPSPSIGPSPANDILPDGVKAAAQRKVFKSKAEVEQNLPRLGEGVSIFIVYAPDPESPYLNPHTRVREINANEKQIFQLVYDLGRHGFHVITDLHLGDKMPHNWLEWYTSRIELCHYILLVGSPAFRELFSREKPQGQILDRRAQLLLSYRNTVYSEISKDLLSNPGASKFIPILLDPRWHSEDSIPSLFGAATVYHLPEREQRLFMYDDRSRDFEKLVCRMAGINRAEIDQPQVIGVQRLPPPFYGGATGVTHPLPVSLETMTKPRPGYKVIQPPYLPPLSGGPSTVTAFPSGPGHVPSTVIGFQRGAPPPLQCGVYHQAGGSQGHPAISAHQPSYRPMQPYPRQPLQYYGGSYPYSQAAPPPQPQVPPQPGGPLPPSSLPDIEPDRTEILIWLSENLVGWPMVARNLQLAEPTIERIKEENLHNVSEQCYQMLDRWSRERPSKFSCRTLGEVLLKSERNKQLYPVYVQRVMALPMDTQ